MKKVVRSAVVVIPPVELWGDIQDIRKDNDKAYERWMPHINMYVFYYVYVCEIKRKIIRK